MRADPPSPLNKFADFLNHHARDKFVRCAFWVEQFYDRRGEFDVLAAFDLLYEGGLKSTIRQNMPLGELNGLIEELNPAADELNVKKMIQVVRESSSSAQSNKRLSLKTYMDTNCRRLQAYKHMLDIENIAGALGGRKSTIKVVNRLNAYYRICSA